VKLSVFTFKRTKNCFKTKRWRKEVLERHNSRCVECGSYKLVECHHIKEKDRFPELQFDVDNGTCLCFKCHSSKHDYMDMYKHQRDI